MAEQSYVFLTYYLFASTFVCMLNRMSSLVSQAFSSMDLSEIKRNSFR